MEYALTMSNVTWDPVEKNTDPWINEFTDMSENLLCDSKERVGLFYSNVCLSKTDKDAVNYHMTGWLPS